MAEVEKKKSRSGSHPARGTYWESHPLDFELLRRMPEEGASLGFHVLALTASHALEEINKSQPREAKMTTNDLQARLRSMHAAGLCVKVRTLGTGGPRRAGWQRTAKGTAAYEEHTGKPISKGANPLKLVEGGSK